MKSFALLLTILWWAQGPLCLLACAPSHAHSPAAASHDTTHAHHGSGHEPAGGQPADPGGDHRCGEHCASLAQAPSTAGRQPRPAAGPQLATAPAAAPAMSQLLAVASGWNVAPPWRPPDLLIRLCVLRV